MYKFKTIFPVLALAVTVMCGCSSNEDVAGGINGENSAITQGEEVEVEFLLKSNNSSTESIGVTRASAEDSGVYSKGSENEYKVKTARVYFYDNNTKNFVMTVDLSNIHEVAAADIASGTFTMNVNEALYTFYKCDAIKVPEGVYDIFVVANSPSQTFHAATEDEFLATVDATTYSKGLINTSDLGDGIMMTNRASDPATLSQTLKKLPNDEKIKVYVTLERVIARLDVAQSASNYGLLKDNNADSLYATVTLTGYHVVNVATSYYLFRHVAQLTSLVEPAWDINVNFGNIPTPNGYVCDPYFFKKTPDAAAAAAFSNPDGFYANFYNGSTADAISWTGFNATVGESNTTYLPENCMIAPAQLNGYSTGVIFKAQFKVSRGESTDSKNNRVYTLDSNGKAVKFSTSATLPQDIYYFNYNFYTSTEALIAHLGIKAEDLYKIAYKKYSMENGQYTSYYPYWIKHLDSPTYLDVMEFAVVRNNLYNIKVAKVLDLGSGYVPKGDTPDEKRVELEITLCVKPWIVRDQTNIEL